MDDEGALAADRILDLTALPPLGELLTCLPEHLAPWMQAQRWFAHKGTGTPTAQLHGWAPLHVAWDHVVVATVVKVRTSSGDEGLYQVPVVLRRPGRTIPDGSGSQIGVLAVPGGPLRVDDAASDHDGRSAILRMLADGSGAAGPELRLASRNFTGSDSLHVQPGIPVGPGATSRLLSGEQSNTSMIVEADDARPVIVKLFRILQDGQNPDVVLQAALTDAGSTRVPAVIGEAHLALGELRTHALFAQEFLPNVEDAWRTALREAMAGQDFSSGARRLGSALAEVHRDLAEAFGTVDTGPELAATMVEQMRERVDAVAHQVPQVERHRAALEALHSRASGATWPAMQRIHGDLHLGQVLSAPGRGWVLLDFEGEPLRPLAQRSRPDCPLRDVAGMLRSLDYAAGAVALEHGADVTDWSRRARVAFLAGYTQGAGISVEDTSLRVLLATFEADKAVYEALYEARNRPDWLPIPLGALERISEADAAAGSAD